MGKAGSSKESYLGCARGYLRLGRSTEAQAEILDCIANWGECSEAYELMIQSFTQSEDWQGLIDFAHSTLSRCGRNHDYGWSCLIRGLLRVGKPHLALRAARSGRSNCGEQNMVVGLESLRVLAITKRFHAARNLYLQMLVADPASASKVVEDPDLKEFLQVYISGHLSDDGDEDDPWADDGNEIR